MHLEAATQIHLGKQCTFDKVTENTNLLIVNQNPITILITSAKQRDIQKAGVWWNIKVKTYKWAISPKLPFTH